MKTYQTIKELVIDSYNSAGEMPPYAELTNLVQQHFPHSKWKKSHYAWYKSQFKTGRLTVSSNPLEENLELIDSEVESSIETRLSIERDLQNYLSKHLAQIAPDLRLHPNGIEFQTDAGRIDILAVDQQKNLVVIEVKAGTAQDKALGQLLGYMGCLSGGKKSVKGVLVAADFEDRVIFAAQCLPNVRLVKYSLSFAFSAVRLPTK